MRKLLASALAGALQATVALTAHASPVFFALDLSFPFAPAPGSDGVPSGTFRNAGSFGVESSLLPSRGNAVISFGQIRDFHLQLPQLEIDPDRIGQGDCQSAAELPVCGFLFSDGRLQGLVGQYASPTSNSRYLFTFANTSLTRFDTRPIFQSVSLDDRRIGAVAASGFVTVRPIPEPVSTLLFGAGGGLLALAERRRRRSRMAGPRI